VTQKTPEQANFTAKELELIERVAKRDGISTDEAATNLGKAALARRTKKRSGKSPAKVYGIHRGRG
jgi:hypothetical protein